MELLIIGQNKLLIPRYKIDNQGSFRYYSIFYEVGELDKTNLYEINELLCDDTIHTKFKNETMELCKKYNLESNFDGNFNTWAKLPRKVPEWLKL